MLKIRIIFLILFILFLCAFILCYFNINSRSVFSIPLYQNIPVNDSSQSIISLKSGDLLVRPNLNCFPGSSKVALGRNFGHVVIVVKGASEQTWEKTLEKSTVIEAVIFDQKSRSFVFDYQDQVRITFANVSFGERFKGIRYRLRMPLTTLEQDFLVKSLHYEVSKSRYGLLANKTPMLYSPCESETIPPLIGVKRNCATLAWAAYIYVTGHDIDSNKGKIIFPNDIICSHLFDGMNGRIRF